MAATLFMKVGHVTVKWPRDLCPLVRVPLPPRQLQRFSRWTKVKGWEQTCGLISEASVVGV